MDSITIDSINHVWCYLYCSERYIEYDLRDMFSFKVPNAYFMPAYKNRMWDGYIRLFNPENKLLYHGLLGKLEEYCKTHSIQINYSGNHLKSKKIDPDILYTFLKELNLPFKIRKYQLAAFLNCVESNRRLILSPTGSGKSLIIYMLVRWYLCQQTQSNVSTNVLIVVPTINLVSQMYSDFEEYGYSSKDNCSKLFGGSTLDPNKRVHISTWQSIYNNSNEFFNSYSCVIMDEAHHCKSKSLTGILEKMTNTPYRFGFTGTLDDMESDKMLVQGLLGPIYQASTTKKLIDKNYLAKIQINNLILSYSNNTNLAKGMSYNDEIEFIIQNEQRTKFIVDLAEKNKGNKLILFTRIVHGESIYNELLKRMKGKHAHASKISENVFLIYGNTDKEERERIRKKMETIHNGILIASYGTFSTGVNIKNLHHIIFSSPYKSKIKVLQSIGRGLRTHESKTKIEVYDLVDNFGGSKENYLLKHFMKRIEYYVSEDFSFKNQTIII